MKASFTHGKANVEDLERSARELLSIPALPNGANGPRSRALLEQIQRDAIDMGRDAALRKHAAVCTVAYACALDDDPTEHKNASKRTIKDLEHPTRKGEYAFPDCARLREALSNPQVRSKCSATALQRLESHAANAREMPEDWAPKEEDRK